ncbi:MAG: DUF983 domain-containing protein [Verrucomicrobiae bacterium]|nr:DUF983 domain-containing protein [Verrucomicrobiae bacterium]
MISSIPVKIPSPLHSAALYFWRALRLRCPLCGISPIFIPLLNTRSLRDWFTPLDGCTRCGYPYEREPGYFLMSIWAINYGLGSLFGIIIYLILESLYDLPIWYLIGLVVVPIILFNFFFARHAKSLFLAIDLFCDPHIKEEGDHGRDDMRPLPPQPIPPSGEGQSIPQHKEQRVLATATRR